MKMMISTDKRIQMLRTIMTIMVMKMSKRTKNLSILMIDWTELKARAKHRLKRVHKQHSLSNSDLKWVNHSVV